MSKRILVLVVLSALSLAACGGSSATTETASDSAAAETQSDGSAGTTVCDDVSLGTFEGQTWSATKIEATNVECDEAEEVAAQWAAQQVGGPSAKLPAGWQCNSDCRKGSARVSFTLGYEG
jgi:hypothetical protein